MRRLLVVSDLYLDPAGIQSGAQAQLPVLPALNELLHFGKPGVRHSDWRDGVAAQLDAAALAGVAPALVAACAVDGITAGSAVCMAQPVHLVAGMASVHLHPAGLLLLEPEAVAELRDQFAREFGAQQRALSGVGDGLLLAAPEAAGASAGDPARLLGSPIQATRSLDPHQRELRRLGVELEMWLPGTALNRDRARRGQLPISALWFWGGGSGALPDVAATISKAPSWPGWVQAYGSDPWLHGIWRRLLDGKPLAARQWDEVSESAALMVVSAARIPLQQLELDWFVPALRDLQSGRVSMLALQIGGRCWQLGARSASRWWQPRAWCERRQWWQVLTA